MKSLQKRSLQIHLIAAVLMILAPLAMGWAARLAFTPAIWAALGAFILANLLECLIA